MLENIARTIAPVHSALRYEPWTLGLCFSTLRRRSHLWDGARSAVLEEMHIPTWLITALRALNEGPTARIVFGGVVTDSFFSISRGVKQGCPSSGSVWALAFDPAVRLLRAKLRGPMGELSVFAADIAAALARLISDLPLLSQMFGLLASSAGLSITFSKTVIDSFGGGGVTSCSSACSWSPPASRRLRSFGSARTSGC